jgi:hypothetical protein
LFLAQTQAEPTPNRRQTFPKFRTLEKLKIKKKSFVITQHLFICYIVIETVLLVKAGLFCMEKIHPARACLQIQCKTNVEKGIAFSLPQL